MTKTRVLVADDDESIVWVLDKFFTEKGFSVLKAGDGEAAADLLRDDTPSMAFLDINMPGKDGLEVLRDASPSTAIIIMTAEDTMTNTLEAMKRGAFDYISKPFDLDEVEILAEKALESTRLRQEVTTLKERLKERLESETVIVGRSKAIREVIKTVGKIAAKDVTVLVQGESGTGKELVSKLIHSNSTRAERPFVAVNSAAVPRELMESELFGYEKGAFTGATDLRKGKFELADEGTLFLDEIGDMSIDVQAKLLRAIQEQEFYRVGGKEPVKVDVRIVAASNQDLEKLVAEKKFRADLLFRLNVVTIQLPPLADRKGDVELLSEYFLERFIAEMGVEAKKLSKKALEEMNSYNWPGNVRELENVLRRATLLSQTVVLGPDDLALPVKSGKRESIEDIIARRLAPFVDSTAEDGAHELYDTVMPYMERPLLKLVLKKTKNNQVRAAEILGINRNTLRKKIKELMINLKELKGHDG